LSGTGDVIDAVQIGFGVVRRKVQAWKLFGG